MSSIIFRFRTRSEWPVSEPRLSIATVEKHLRMARDALDVQSTVHAVQKAMSLNLLT